MHIQNMIDNAFDPFFKKFGSTLVVIANIVMAVAFPPLILLTFVAGSKELPNGGFEVDFWYMGLVYLILITSLAGRYTRRFERRFLPLTVWCMTVALIGSLVVTILTFPGGPLASYWHVPGNPWSNLTVAMPVILGLAVGIVGNVFKMRRIGNTKTF